MSELGLARWIDRSRLASLLAAPRTWLRRISNRTYRLFIAGLVVALLVLEALQADPVLRWLTGAGILAYAVYVAARMVLPVRWESRYYTGRVQFWRAQAGIVGVTLLLGTYAFFQEPNTLWILYVLGLMIVSQHCPTEAFLVTVTEINLFLVGLGYLESGMPAAAYLRFSPDLGLAILRTVSIALVGFLVHYLVEKRTARDESIARYRELLAALAEDTRSLRSPALARDLVLRLCSDLLDADCATLWLFDAPEKTLTLATCARDHCAAGRDCPARHGDGPVSLPLDDRRLPASVARSGEPVVASSVGGILGRVSDIRRASRPFLPEANLEVGFPIPDFQTRQGASPAVLSVGFHRGMNPDQAHDAYEAVHDVTRGLNPVLYSASLLEQYQALQELGNAVTHSLELDRILETLLALVTDVFGFDFATVSLVDDEKGVIETVRGAGDAVSQDWIEMAVHPLDSDDIQAHVVRTGEMEIISGWDDRFDPEIWERFDHKDMVRIFLPMSVIDPASGERRCIGTLEAGYRHAHGTPRAAITDAQVDLLRPFVNQAAIAVAKARLYQETERLYHESRRTAEVLTALHHGGQAIQSAVWDHQELLQQIGHSAEKVLGADLVLLFDYDEERHRAELPFIGGDVRGRGTPAPRLDQGNILDAIIETREPFYRPDAQEEPLLVDYGESHRRGHRTFTQRQGVVSFAGLPLIGGDELIGIMCVNYRQRRPFSPEEKRTIELFAQQAAIALKSDRLRQQERQLAIARERTTFSKELHCYLSTELFSIGVKMETALLHVGRDRERVQSEMEDTLQMIRDAQNRLGYLISEFDADEPREEDFPTVLKETVDRIRDFLSIDVRCRGNGGHDLPPRVHFALSRIAKESLNNVIRHANCSRAEVTYAVSPVAASLQVADDGRGFRIGRVLEKSERLGIKSIQSYVRDAHGDLTIDSAPGRGTVISVRVPLQAPVQGG